MILLRKAGERIFVIIREGEVATAIAADKILAMKSDDSGDATRLTLYWDDDHPVETRGPSVYELIEAIDDFEISDETERLLDGDDQLD